MLSHVMTFVKQNTTGLVARSMITGPMASWDCSLDLCYALVAAPAVAIVMSLLLLVHCVEMTVHGHTAHHVCHAKTAAM